MKRLFLLGFLFLMSVSVLNAQDVFKKGTNVFQAGVGVGDGIPLEVSFEHGVLDKLINGDNGSIGVGAYGSWYSRSKYDWRYNHIVIGARGAFHYQFIDKLDTYLGLMLGYNVASASWKGDGSALGTATGSAFDFSLYLGGRYYFTPKYGMYAEVGYGIAYLSLGVAIKF